MQIEDSIKAVDAVTRLLGVLAWPAVMLFALAASRPAIRDFLVSLSEVRVKGAGFEASAMRRLNFDATSQKLYEYWKPDGRVNRANAAKITACMKQSNVAGSVASLINAGTADDRAKIASCLSL